MPGGGTLVRVTAAEWAWNWRVPAVSADMDLLHARFRRHAFARHSHDSYAIGVLEGGEEGLHWRGSHHVAGPGAVVVINPGDVHTGHSTTPDGWTYRMLYPPVDLLGEVLGRPADTVRFPAPVVHDPVLAAALTRAHRALSGPDLVLEGHTRLLHALHHLVGGHGRSNPAPRESVPRRRLPSAALWTTCTSTPPSPSPSRTWRRRAASAPGTSPEAWPPRPGWLRTPTWSRSGSSAPAPCWPEEPDRRTSPARSASPTRAT